MNVRNPAAQLKQRAQRFGFVVLLQPDRPSGWTALVRPSGTGLIDPVEVTAPTREEAIELAGRVFEQQLVAHLVNLLDGGGVDVPSWEPGVVWDDHVERLFGLVRANGLDA